MANDRACQGCFHNYGMFRVNVGCNYIFDMGHRRPCQAGEGCTEYITEEAALSRGMRRKAKGLF